MCTFQTCTLFSARNFLAIDHSGTKFQPKEEVFGTDIPRTSGGHSRGYPDPELRSGCSKSWKNKHLGADIHDPKARTSTTLRDSWKLRSEKLWAEFRSLKNILENKYKIDIPEVILTPQGFFFAPCKVKGIKSRPKSQERKSSPKSKFWGRISGGRPCGYPGGRPAAKTSVRPSKSWKKASILVRTSMTRRRRRPWPQGGGYLRKSLLTPQIARNHPKPQIFPKSNVALNSPRNSHWIHTKRHTKPHWIPLNSPEFFSEISRISPNSPKFCRIPEISVKSGEERKSRNQAQGGSKQIRSEKLRAEFLFPEKILKVRVAGRYVGCIAGVDLRMSVRKRFPIWQWLVTGSSEMRERYLIPSSWTSSWSSKLQEGEGAPEQGP